MFSYSSCNYYQIKQATNNSSTQKIINKKKNIYSLLLILFLFTCSLKYTKAKFAFNLYNTNEELLSEFDKLVSDCEINKMQKHFLKNDDNDKAIESDAIPYYSIASQDFDESSSKAHVAFMLFGEHSRELIPTETALFLAKSLCNKIRQYSKSTISKTIKNTKIYILPILNLAGRKQVAEGNYCKRTNEHDVDLNRNWDSHWSKGEDYDQTNPGSFPFSEWETAKLKKLLEILKPKTFITTHSGNLGMYSPFAYKKFLFKELTDNLAKNLKIIQSIIMKINKHYCNCISGSIGNDLGYLCPGTCLDYAFENLNIAHSFAFEIYSEKQSQFYRNILESDNLEYFDYDKFEERDSKASVATLIQMKMRSNLKSIKLSVIFFL